MLSLRSTGPALILKSLQGLAQGQSCGSGSRRAKLAVSTHPDLDPVWGVASYCFWMSFPGAEALFFVKREKLHERCAIFKEAFRVARHSHCGEDKVGGTEEELLTVGQCNVLSKGGVREAGGAVPFGPVP